MKQAILAAVAAITLAPAAALAQWSDGFESYSNGQLLDNVGGWAGWDNVSGAAGTATNSFAHTGNQSIFVGGRADAVHPFSGYTSGFWTLSTWMLLFQNDHVRDTFFIVNNVYNHGGPYQWAIQLKFDRATGNVFDDLRFGNSASIAYGQWAEIRIDLTANTQTTWYDGQLLSSGTWTVRPGPLAIANIDLFANGSRMWYDDFNLVPARAPWRCSASAGSA